MLTIRITKRTDGNAVLKCIRDDGSETWQKQEGRHAAFFPLHDLTHYSVETELRLADAFYGLIDQGWSITDTEGQGPRGPLPHDASFAENVVGTLDVERAAGARWTAAEFNDATARHAVNGGRPIPRQITDEELRRLRRRRAELFAQWSALPAGATLELRFDAAALRGEPARG